MRTIVVLGLLLAITGCSKSGPSLTKASIQAAHKDLKGKAWDTSLADLKARLGEPRVEDEGEYTWAVAEGDGCYALTARDQEGKADLGFWESTAAKQPGYNSCLEDAKKYK